MTWTQETATLLGTSVAHDNLCDAGHDSHVLKEKHVELRGPTGVPDFPPFVGGLQRSLDIALYDWEQYEGIQVYCPGNDAVSQSIDIQGVWEGFETLLALDILERSDSDPLFVDLGSQVGWYTLLAAGAGARVLAVDADKENLRALEAGARANGFEMGVDIVSTHAWLGSESPVVEPGDHIRLLKADVEGAEIDVARIWAKVFQAGLIDYALMEVTPQFSDRYPEIVGGIMECGYTAHVIPDKGHPLEEFSLSPLDVTMRSSLLLSDIRAFTRQENILLAKI